jgi:hypothetical protein
MTNRANTDQETTTPPKTQQQARCSKNEQATQVFRETLINLGVIGEVVAKHLCKSWCVENQTHNQTSSEPEKGPGHLIHELKHQV